MVDGVIEAILMLFFLKSLRNGEKKKRVNDEEQDFDFPDGTKLAT